nr:MAG TPA: hypothetical protein [Caudoviricetes sp.]
MINKEFINTKLKEVEDEFNEIDKKSIALKEELAKIETRKEQLKGTYTAFYQMLTMLDDSNANQDESDKKEDTTNTNEDVTEDTENNN